MFGFGKAPNTAGGFNQWGGSIGGSQDQGGIFSGVPNRFKSPDNDGGYGRVSNKFRAKKMTSAVQNSINYGTRISNSRDSDFNTIQNSSSNWRK